MLSKSDKSYIFGSLVRLQKELDWIEEVLDLILDQQGLEVSKVYAHLELKPKNNHEPCMWYDVSES